MTDKISAQFQSGGTYGPTSSQIRSRCLNLSDASLFNRQEEGTGVSQLKFKKQKNVEPKASRRDRPELESQSPNT